MSQRTDGPFPERSREFPNEYLLTLAGVTLAVLVVVFGIEHGVGPGTEYRNMFQVVFAFPWIIAGGISIANGLDHFSGAVPQVLSGQSFWAPLVPLLIIGVVGVTLVLRLMSSREHPSEISQGRRVVYLVGLILCSTYIFTLIPVAIIQRSTGASLREAAAIQQNKDYIIGELATVAWRIREHAILPVLDGGGAGDIRSFDLADVVAGSENAAYMMEWEGDKAIIVAQSKSYADATVRVMVDSKGRIGDWTYSGRFE